MAQSPNQQIQNQFNKGLLTEFSPLNFPENASVDELNCVLFKSGERSKRLGIQEEADSTRISGNFLPDRLFHVTTWENVAQDASLEYVVVQSGGKVRFFKKGVHPLSDGAVPTSNTNPAPYVLSLSPYNTPYGTGAATSKIDVTSINGELIIVSPQIEAIKVTRNDDGSFTDTQIDFRVRDYEWQGFRNSYNDLSVNAPAGPGRQYDTKNCGWSDGADGVGDDALTTYTTAKSGYWPPLTHPWYSGKTSAGVFSVTEWEKVYSGSSLISNGHYILDLFDKDRETVSGVVGAGRELVKSRFSAVATYAGRVWYAGVGSKVYYSQIVENSFQVGELFQSNDPTSEESPDILATDGGYIHIPEAQGIKKLHPFGSSLLVFADNGVWRVSGIDGNLFKADDFSVYKITDFGLAFRTSLVAGQNAVPFWWSYTGIHTIQVTEGGGLAEVNLSRDTIQTFFDQIGSDERTFVTGIYDSLEDQVVWAYPEANESTEYKLNRLLFLDVSLGAFYPWKISDAAGTSPYVVGMSFYSGKGSNTVTFEVIDSNGNNVVDSSGNIVTVDRDAGVAGSSNVYFATLVGTEFNFSRVNSTSYLDWGTANYEAYAESAFNFSGDLGRRKSNIYITVFMRQTETGFVVSGSGYDAVDESSLKVSGFWDFKNTPSTTQQEAYRLKYPVYVDPLNLDTFDYPSNLIATRLKLRGRGRVLKLRFEGQQGKGFKIVGWETLNGVNPRY